MASQDSFTLDSKSVSSGIVILKCQRRRVLHQQQALRMKVSPSFKQNSELPAKLAAEVPSEHLESVNASILWKLLLLVHQVPAVELLPSRSQRRSAAMGTGNWVQGTFKHAPASAAPPTYARLVNLAASQPSILIFVTPLETFFNQRGNVLTQQSSAVATQGPDTILVLINVVSSMVSKVWTFLAHVVRIMTVGEPNREPSKPHCAAAIRQPQNPLKPHSAQNMPTIQQGQGLHRHNVALERASTLHIKSAAMEFSASRHMRSVAIKPAVTASLKPVR
jgi:hypothetical protein